jgi:Gram-negative bacterial TonB protein C-terminal
MKKEIKAISVYALKSASNLWIKATSMLAFSLFSMPIKAQQERPIPLANTVESTQKKDNFLCIYVSEPAPEFIGGSKALFKFLGENLHFTSDSTGTDETIYVGFVVETDGSISDVTIKRGLGNAANEEAVRVVKLMSGHWKCAIQNGKPVSVRFTLPIKIHLE